MTGKQLIKKVNSFATIADAARNMGIPRSTLSGIYHKALDGLSLEDEKNYIQDPKERASVDVQVYKIKGAKKHSDDKYKALVKQLADKEQQLEDAIALSSDIRDVQIEPISVESKKGRSQSTAVVVASDWHLEERVKPETIEHLNQYTVNIAEKRAKAFFRNALKLIEMSRSNTNIDNLILALIGDFITGYIHPELMESNQLSPVQACVKAFEWLCSGIDFLLKHGKFKRILIPCCVGNHGRTTEKRRISTEQDNSYEWLLYQFISNHYKDNPRIEMQAGGGYLSYLKVYDMTLRFHHGHNVRFGGGVGGISVPLNKAIAQWDKFKRADLDVIGHWHQRQSTNKYVINGSLIGYNAYALSIKAEFENPCQTFFLLHPDKGKTVEAPILV